MDDLISRQAAKSKKVYSHERHEYVVPVAELDWLPPAQPESKTISIKHQLTKDEIERLRKVMANSPVVLFPERKPGRWIKTNNTNYSPFDNSPEYNMICSECFYTSEKVFNFCPNCGAMMEGWT